nr:hypothetical protein [Tanacetum cinerariifolium]
WSTGRSGSPLQTALVCKSNPLMVARLPKTGCMVINSPYYSVYEELASPEQTASVHDVRLILLFLDAAVLVYAACVIAAATLYLLGGYKQSYFKGMKYEYIRPIFERVWDQIHTFVPKDIEIEKEVMKRYGFNLQQESSKKHKLDEQTEEEVEAQVDTDQEVEEMKLYMKIVSDIEIAIDAIPLDTKPLVIVEYKIVKEGNISTYHIIRVVGSTKRYTSMINLLENIDRENLETL